MKKLENHVEIRLSVLALALLLVSAVAGVAAEGDEDVASLIERGKTAYTAHCASCHGAEGLGDGVVAQYLTVKPANLTRISAEGGEFPFDRVYQTIDGLEVAGHGGREMPVWGPAFMGLDEESGKRAVKEKIVELVYYLKSIQGSDQ